MPRRSLSILPKTGPLARAEFRVFLVAQTVSLLGNAIGNVALPLVILQISGSSVQLGIVAGIQTTTMLGLLLVAGAIVDRAPARMVLIASHIGRGAILLVGGLLLIAGRIEPWHLYVVAAVLGAGAAFSTPALTSFTAEILPRDQLLEGNTVKSVGRNLARIVGGGLGGLLIVAWGAAPALIFDASTFFVAAGALGLIRRISARPTRHQEQRLLHSIAEGLRVVPQSRWIAFTLLLFAMTNLVTSGLVQVAVPLVALENLGGAASLGAFTAATAVGALGAGAAASRVGQAPNRGGLGYLVSACGSLGLAIVPLGPGLISAVVGGFAFGMGSQFFSIIWESSLQELVPRAALGRIASVDALASFALIPVGVVLAGLLATVISPAILLTVGGLTTAAVKLGALSSASLRSYEPERIARMPE